MFCPYIILILAERTRQTKYKVRNRGNMEQVPIKLVIELLRRFQI